MSKTDHARVKGSHRVGHAERAWRKEDHDRLPTRPALAMRDEIAEGLALVHAPIDLDERYTMRECVSEWEYLHTHAPANEPDWAEEPLADWERELLGQSVAEPVDDDEDWPTDWTAWLTTPPQEFFDAVGNAYVLEGPDGSRDRTSGKADGYLRAYELARLVGINTAHMVEYLRDVHGEWVAGPTAYVALPVCERMVSLADDLQAEYGRRDMPVTWAEQRAAWGFR